MVLAVLLALAPSAPATAVGVIGNPPDRAELRALVRAELDGPVPAAEPALDPPSPSPAARSLARAKRALGRAESALARLLVDRAAFALEQAERALEPVLGLPEAHPLDRDRWLLEAEVAHARRDSEAVDTAVERLAARHGPIDPPRRFSPELRARVEAAPLPPGVPVTIRTTPPGARVHLDGRPACERAPCTAVAPPGPARVVADAEGYERIDESHPLTEGLVIELVLEPAAGAVLAGLVSLDAVDGVGERILDEWASRSGVDAVVLVERRGRQLRLRRLDRGRGLGGIAEGTDPAVVVRALDAVAPAGSALTPVAWATGAGGTLAVGVGVALRLVAQATQASTLARSGALTQVEHEARREQAERESLAGGVLIGAGAAAVVGGLLLGWLGGGG